MNRRDPYTMPATPPATATADELAQWSDELALWAVRSTNAGDRDAVHMALAKLSTTLFLVAVDRDTTREQVAA